MSQICGMGEYPRHHLATISRP